MLYHSTIKRSPKEKFNLKNTELNRQLDKEEKQRVKTTLKKRLTINPIVNTNQDLDPGDMVRKKIKNRHETRQKAFLIGQSICTRL